MSDFADRFPNHRAAVLTHAFALCGSKDLARALMIEAEWDADAERGSLSGAKPAALREWLCGRAAEHLMPRKGEGKAGLAKRLGTMARFPRLCVPGAIAAKASERSRGERDTREFNTQLTACLPKLKARAFKLAGNRTDADDLVQETALRAVRGTYAPRPGKTFLHWLNTIMRNQHFTAHRSRSRRPVEDTAETEAGTAIERAERAGSAGSAQPNQEHSVMLRATLRAIAAMPRNGNRRALEMIALDGLEYTEAAALAGVHDGTIKSQVHRAREALRSTLGGGLA